MGEEEETEEAMMARMMGFSALGSTHGKHVTGNQELGTVSVQKPRTWRQYMNRCDGDSLSLLPRALSLTRSIRRGGFNRPLDKI